MKIDLDDVQCLKETKVTIRGYRRRTTIPKEIAEMLELKNGDIIFWVAMKDGRVLLKKPEV
ncbi:MAG: AbrB/MazE/SpoVT family DNA-binding domain-containing protein [Methanomicrobia archaeon]|nr:AbrB/MazE/SpoVT family DNA-binding domain-containing protein [Methanomicrobia archaeon]